MSSTNLGWGIVGTGHIAHDFTSALANVAGCNVAAVGSRGLQRGANFASVHRIPRHHGSYEALVNDPSVDVVYVATPHSEHAQHVTLALDAGKAVLCEKTFAMSRHEGQRLFALARQRGLFLMEANWMCCFPLVQRALEWLRQGAIGEVQVMQANLGFVADRTLAPALFDPAMGGGSLTACGVYGLTLGLLCYAGSESPSVSCSASITESGVDEHCAITLDFASAESRTSSCRRLAHVESSIGSLLPGDAWIAGTHGRLHLGPMFCGPTRLIRVRPGKSDVIEEAPLPEVSGRFNYPNSRGLAHEARHVVDCLRQGRTTSPYVTPELTLTTLSLMDQARAQFPVVTE